MTYNYRKLKEMRAKRNCGIQRAELLEEYRQLDGIIADVSLRNYNAREGQEAISGDTELLAKSTARHEELESQILKMTIVRESNV
jgi:hypothetical protein